MHSYRIYQYAYTSSSVSGSFHSYSPCSKPEKDKNTPQQTSYCNKSTTLLGEAGGSHGGDYNNYFLRCDAVWFDRLIPRKTVITSQQFHHSGCSSYSVLFEDSELSFCAAYTMRFSVSRILISQYL